MVISQVSAADNNTIADNSNQKNESTQPQNEKPVTKKKTAIKAIAKTNAGTNRKDDNSGLLAANTQPITNNVPVADKKTAVGHPEKAAVAGNKTLATAGDARAATPTAGKAAADVKGVATEKVLAANEAGKAAPVKLHKKTIAAPAVGTISRRTAAGHDKNGNRYGADR